MVRVVQRLAAQPGIWVVQLLPDSLLLGEATARQNSSKQARGVSEAVLYCLQCVICSNSWLMLEGWFIAYVWD
jgi:hypothetical protein